MRILTVNAGSSSLKLRLLDADDALLGDVELAAEHGRAEAGALRDALARMDGADAVAHRVVHGGTRFTGPVQLDDEVVTALEALTPLAPLHQPAALDAMSAVAREMPALPAVACLDTAFHSQMPPAAAAYALPPEWVERHGLRRFGFHGLSHAYASRRAAELIGRPLEELRIVTCHLGAGASLAAIDGGRSVDTTMGFTPVEGLVMATRSGTVDPDVPLHLVLRHGVPAAEVERALNEDSGLRALAGTGDMREVEAAAGRGDEGAALALAVHDHRLAAAVAAMAAALGGLDALVFTGGVGEGSGRTRAEAARRLAFLGVAVDPAADPGEGDADLSATDARVRTMVVRAREDLVIARAAREVIGMDDSEEARR
ncbi:MAG: acetate/propionate family kinase [Solirubrobacteraceae bacterium]